MICEWCGDTNGHPDGPCTKPATHPDVLAERERCAQLLEDDARLGEHAFRGVSVTLRSAARLLREQR